MGAGQHCNGFLYVSTGMARSSGPDSPQARFSVFAEWYKLILGGIVILVAVALLISKYVFGYPVSYEDIGILVVLGGGLLQIDFGLNLLQIVRQSTKFDDTPPPRYVSPPPYTDDPTRVRPPVDPGSESGSESEPESEFRSSVSREEGDSVDSGDEDMGSQHGDTGRGREGDND